ncbi:hypothetical protein HFP15_02850 [Amycolatopsis sp. K13G38]|uniref:Uncharacterized protein n=1 Tax=Amycolatopsis acididurans TaxID=2724524 RepID=A0ABX1IWE8_9PSEU|nr:hypothetical protein [Amycolatopsis acididurans]NKQ51816.1 hypothetical protein [Amycolatopsis acididurans]
MEAPSSPEKLDIALRAVERLPLPAGDWRFDIHPWRVRVLAGQDARETRVAAGAAIFVLALMLRAQGCAVRTELLPEPGAPDLLAVIRFAGRRLPMPGDARLAAAVATPGLSRPLTGGARRALRHAAAVEGVRLRFTDATRAVLFTRRDDRFAQLTAGLAAGRVLLTAAALGARLRWDGGPPSGTRAQAVLAVEPARVEVPS